MATFLFETLTLTNRRHATMRYRTPANKNAKQLFLQEPFVNARLVAGDMRKLVVKPKYVDEKEWLAANAYDFFHQVNLFFGTVSEVCIPQSCPTMSAGENCEYIYWGEPRQTKMPAAQYIDLTMVWIGSQVESEAIFPTKAGIEFPPKFDEIVKLVFKRLFRVLAHLYYSHFDRIIQTGEEAHLNTLFTHFVLFAQQFDLIDRKEYQPMQELIDELITKPISSADSASSSSSATPSATSS